MSVMDRLERAAQRYRSNKNAFDEAETELRAAVREARAEGLGPTEIARRIGMNRETVRRYCQD